MPTQNSPALTQLVLKPAIVNSGWITVKTTSDAIIPTLCLHLHSSIETEQRDALIWINEQDHVHILNVLFRPLHVANVVAQRTIRPSRIDFEQ